MEYYLLALLAHPDGMLSRGVVAFTERKSLRD